MTETENSDARIRAKFIMILIPIAARGPFPKAGGQFHPL
jgi:hypothetical protein